MRRRRRTDSEVGLGRPRRTPPHPRGRVPPFLVLPAEEPEFTAVLVAPFPIRRRGPLYEERMMVEALATRLVGPPDGPQWLDPQTGEITPASIGAGQIQRRLLENACFNVLLSSPVTAKSKAG